MRSFVGWVVGLVFLLIFPKPWDCSSWFNYKIWVCFIPSSSEIFGKPHFRQHWGLVQERSLWSSLKFWTEGFLANGKERNKDASLIAGCRWAGASVGLSAAGLVWIQLCLVRSRRTRKASGEVHGAQRVLVHLHCLSKCLVVSAVALARSVASFSTETEGRGGKTKTNRLGEKRNPTAALIF